MNWLVGNPYPETIQDESSGVVVPSDKHKFWQQGAVSEAAHVYLEGNKPCPHYGTHLIRMTKRECSRCWDELGKIEV